METKMKIKEYAADVVEYTEVVDAPYNLTGGEEVLDERPMGFIKGGLQKLGAKVLPGSFGDRMQGKVEVGQQANQLYKEFNIFLGKSGYPSNDAAIKAFLQQKGINVDVDSIIKSAAPAPVASPAAAPTPAAPASKGFNVKLPQKGAPAPVTENVDNLNRILILSGRSPKKLINEEVALNRGALNKIFMQIAQQMSSGQGGSVAAPNAGGAPPAASGNPSATPAPAAPKAAAPAAPKAAASAGGSFSGDEPAPTPAASGSPAPAPVASPATAPTPKAAPASSNPAPTASGSPAPAPVASPATAPTPKAAPASSNPAPTASGAAPGKLGGAAPGATAASAAKAQGQSTQNLNSYVKNVSAQINAAKTPKEKVELAKELINFMADRKDSPEYDNAMGAVKGIVKGVNPALLNTLSGGKTAKQNPQGLQTPPKAASKAAIADPAAAQDAAREKKRVADLIQRESINDSRKVLHRNSYIFLKKVFENCDLTFKELGYRVSVTESTSDTVTLIAR